MPPPNGSPLVPELPTIEVDGQRWRIIVARTIVTDRTAGFEQVRSEFDGPDGPAFLFGPLARTFQLVWNLDQRLSQLARGDA